VDRAGNAALIAAASESGVRRFVFVSALGASVDHPMPFLRAKAETERRLAESGIDWTVLQPNFYMEMLPLAVVAGPAMSGQPVTLIGEGRRRHSLVSMADVAAYAVAAIRRADAVGQTLVIGGPEPVSWRDVVAEFERELRRDVPIQTVPMGSQVPGLPELVSGLLTSLETYDSPIDMTEIAARYGITPTPLRTFVHGFVAAQPVQS
jgi:NADH dehydrogenase